MSKITNETPIWKTEVCLTGECSGVRNSHQWSLPTCFPGGQMCQCLHCHKLRKVNWHSDNDLTGELQEEFCN